MSKKAKKICTSISIFFALITIAEGIFMFFKPQHFKVYVPIAIILAAILICLLCVLGIFKRKDFLFKLGIMCGFFGAIGVGIYLGMQLSGIMELLNDTANIKEFIAKTGVWGPIVFIVIQFAQVTIIPIPSTVTILAGLTVFSLVEVLLYSMIGSLLGSMFAFALGKIFGVKLVVWLVGEKSFNKYQKIIKGRDKTMLFLMFLLPVFPDDLLCLIAGITTMSYTTFFIMQMIARPIGILITASGGELLKAIPFTGWYIAVWVGLGLLIVVMFICVWKFSGVLEDKLVKVLTAKISTKTVNTVDLDALKLNAKNLVSDATVVTDADALMENKYLPPVRKTPKYQLNYRE